MDKYTDEELIAELEKRGYTVSAPAKIEAILERFEKLKLQADMIKTNAISPDAGIPQR